MVWQDVNADVGDEPAWWGPRCTIGVSLGLVELVARTLGWSEAEARACLSSRIGPVPRYLIHERLGWSESVRVARAVDLHLARAVVLKVFLDDHALDEARAVALARHPNVVQIYELGAFDGVDYMVLEYCEGTTLLAWAEDKPWREVIGRILETGRGLLHCHRHLIVHGDIKPTNILLTQDRAVLADFGLAGEPRLLDVFGGTPGYIAPEIADGLRGMPADVFALACTAWRLLFGALPHKGSSVEGLLIAAQEWPPKPPAKQPEDMPTELLEVLALGLHPKPTHRPKLAAWLDMFEEAAKIPETDARLRRVVRNAAVMGAVFMILGASGHAVVMAYTSVEEPQPKVVEETVAQPVTIETALGHAKSGDPLSAWTAFWVVREVGPVSADECLELALVLLELAEASEELEVRVPAAVAVKRVAEHGYWRSLATDQASVDPTQFGELTRSAQALLSPGT